MSEDNKDSRLLTLAEAHHVLTHTARTAEMHQLRIRAQRVIAMAEDAAGVPRNRWHPFLPGVRLGVDDGGSISVDGDLPALSRESGPMHAMPGLLERAIAEGP